VNLVFLVVNTCFITTEDTKVHKGNLATVERSSISARNAKDATISTSVGTQLDFNIPDRIRRFFRDRVKPSHEPLVSLNKTFQSPNSPLLGHLAECECAPETDIFIAIIKSAE
jgi:hypothetical protein